VQHRVMYRQELARRSLHGHSVGDGRPPPAAAAAAAAGRPAQLTAPPRSTDSTAPRSTDKSAPLRPVRAGGDDQSAPPSHPAAEAGRSVQGSKLFLMQARGILTKPQLDTFKGILVAVKEQQMPKRDMCHRRDIIIMTFTLD
jgi:hypothetical protein